MLLKRALISVSDKNGIVDLALALHNKGIEIISTGGTAKILKDNGINVIGISEITGFPECLDGRVKTLHPSVHGGLLAMRSNPEHMKQLEELNITPIDIVVINLYPFKETISKPDVSLEEAIENIDIGGPAMLRSAAKNYQDVVVLTDPKDYNLIIKGIGEGEISIDTRYRLALKVFEHTSHYDAMISQYLRNQIHGKLPELLTLTYERVQELRYGENPHQKAVFYKEIGENKGSLVHAIQLHGKELSFNNINDINGALELLKEYEQPTVVAVKHTNACGVGSGYDIYDAYLKAYNCDLTSIFGGIVAANRTIDSRTAEELSKIFLEIIIAPDFEEEALQILSRKKNIRLLKLDDIDHKQSGNALDMKKIYGGLLVQTVNQELYADEEMRVVTERIPTEREMEDMIFAWKVVKHLKSNAIVVAKDQQTIGIGPGQVNRIWAVENALKQSLLEIKGSVMASDAFFPFSDCVAAAAKAGVSAIIQPGGSVLDQASIQMADQYGIAMVFTGMRHFKH